jgi:sugar phosphate isomerase/epimerase
MKKNINNKKIIRSDVRMNIGLHWRLTDEAFERLEADFQFLSSKGLDRCSCGIRIPDFYKKPELYNHFLEVLESTGIELQVLSCNLGPPTVYDLVDGPRTVGFVPTEHRERRYKILDECAEFASKIGVKKVVTHFGFIPEFEDDPNYPGVVEAAQKVAEICAAHDVIFMFETGEESPTTLLRLLEDANRPNLAVNLDMGNLVLYGKGEPCGAIDVLGDRIICSDAKDGFYPSGGRILGKEALVGQGEVNFKKVVRKFMEIGYSGSIMIEHEAKTIDKRIEGILTGKKILEGLIEQEVIKRKPLDTESAH